MLCGLCLVWHNSVSQIFVYFLSKLSMIRRTNHKGGGRFPKGMRPPFTLEMRQYCEYDNVG